MNELELSILTFDEVNNRYRLRLAAGPWANHDFAVTPTVCNKPACDCTHVRFVRSEQAPENEAEPFSYFSLDARGRCASGLPESHSSPLARQFAEAAAAELTDSDWEDLLGYAILSKQIIIEEADVLTLDIVGLQDMLADTDHLLGYSDVFPLSIGFPFMLGTEYWKAEDEYCIDSECKCHEALLTFTRLDKPGGTEETKPAVYYDYETFLTTPEDPPAPGQPALDLLVSELIQFAKELPILLKYRHNQLRILTLRAQIQQLKKQVHAAGNRAIAADSKTGRNDPCPCGSGRKFKKCCGLPGANGF